MVKVKSYNVMSCSKHLPVLSFQGARVKESPGKQALLYRSGRVPSDEIVWGLMHLCQV